MQSVLLNIKSVNEIEVMLDKEAFYADSKTSDIRLGQNRYLKLDELPYPHWFPSTSKGVINLPGSPFA